MSMDINNETDLTVRLKGQAVKDGEIDIDNYLEYLSGISELCKAVNNYVNPGSDLEVKVHYTIEKGSIINLLRLAIKTAGIFTGMDLNYSIEDLLAFIGLIDEKTTGLIQLLKKQQNKKLKGKIELSDGKVQFHFDGENSSEEIVQVTQKVAELFQNAEIRKKTSNSVKILKKDGFEQIGFKTVKNKDYNYIDKRDVPYLDYKQNIKEQMYSIYEATIVMFNIPAGNVDNRWRFQEGNGPTYFWAYVKDENFKATVKREGFKPPFTLRVKIKKEQKIDENGAVIEVEKEILEVLEIIELPQQSKLNQTHYE